MKIKHLVAIVALLCVAGVSNLHAQFNGGVGLLYGTQIDQPGIQVNGYYALPAVDKLSVGGDLSFYFPHKTGVVKNSMWELNINGHYSFYNQSKADVYGLAGLNITGWKSKYNGNQYYNGGSVSGSKGGLNIGGGAQAGVGFGKIFGEVKYVISDYDHVVFTAGVRLPF